jgi:hypothetical protein
MGSKREPIWSSVTLVSWMEIYTSVWGFVISLDYILEVVTKKQEVIYSYLPTPKMKIKPVMSADINCFLCLLKG